MARLSWASVLLVSALALAGCATPYSGTAPYPQDYGDNYYAPSPNPYAAPWVGSNTPWVYYSGDWFLNGMLYNYYGNQYGWAPYYAYPPTYIVRPNNWYAPRWNTWYQQHPQYRQSFTQKYPYWRDHHYGQHYDQNFYNSHHRGQGGGWQKGFHGSAMGRPQPAGPGPGHSQVAPREGPRPGGPGQFTPREIPPPGRVATPEGPRPGPTRVTPHEGPRPYPGQVAPREAPRPGYGRAATPQGPTPGPTRVTPREGQGPYPGQMTPREGSRPGPARLAPPERSRPSPARVTPQEAPKRAAPREERRPGAGQVTPQETPRPGPAGQPQGR